MQKRQSIKVDILVGEKYKAVGIWGETVRIWGETVGI